MTEALTKNQMALMCAAVLLVSATAGAATANDNTAGSADAQILATVINQYKAAKSSPRFISLAPGAVKPEGWLRDWAETSAEGYVSDLHNRHVVFAKGWTGEEYKSKGSAGRGLRWPLEQSAYWLDGLVRLAYILDDPQLKEMAHKRLDQVVDGVNNGGETFIWWEPREVVKVEGGDERFDRFTRNFNNWSHAHMGRALVAYYKATGDPDILKALTKVYADFPLHDLAEDEFFPHGSATNLDPMLETYALSGDDRVLSNALAFTSREAFKKLTHKWANDELPHGHTALYYEHARVPALTFPWTGDGEALEASQRVLQLGLEEHGLPVGVASGHEHLMGKGSIRGLETCDIATAGWANKWMMQITGDGRYGDQVEQILLNGFPAAVSRDFDLVCYFQTMNRIDKVVPIHVIKNIEGYEYSKTAGKTLCCVANSTRMIPDYVQHAWMATMDGGLAATLYGPNKVESYVSDGKKVAIVSDTNYPFSSDITLTVSPETDTRFPLYLRIPEWCASPEVTVNGESQAVKADDDGFMKIDREWSGGDKVGLKLPMAVRVVKSETTPVPDTEYFKKPNRATPITKVDKFGQPYKTVHYGPLLFALPMKDKTPNEAEGGDDWNYALNIPAGDNIRQAQVVSSAMPDNFHWQLDSPLKLQVPAVKFDWNPHNTQPLPDEPVTGGTSETITLVPYGATKFRVSMFPVADPGSSSSVDK